MKRVYLILTLFMTSFFFFTLGVSADVTTYEVKEEHMGYIRTDEFKSLREKVIEYCNNNSLSYLIIADDSGKLSAHTFTQKDSIPIKWMKTDTFFAEFTYSGATVCKILNENLSCTGSKTSNGFYFITSSLGLRYNAFLDTNIENSYYYNSNIEFIIKYNDLSYNIVQNSHIPTLYEIYLESIGSTEEVDPNAEILNNFYILVIDKIKLLSNYIATNYIILSALVIFIFVAIIGLVRRLK